MRIENNLSVARAQGVRSKNVAGIEAPTDAKLDSVELSSRAADVRAAMEALAAVPEIREERVDELRAQLQSGSFDPAVDALAEKLLKR
jgi:negative regulator of flagellin synthesis FlgM